MKAIIIVAEEGQTLNPFTSRTSPALLPVVGKALLVHTIERLADAGVTSMIIATSRRADLITQALGDGTAWGVSINTMTWGNPKLSDELSPTRPSPGARLIVRGDTLWSMPLDEFQAFSQSGQKGVVRACIGGRYAGVALYPAEHPIRIVEETALLGTPLGRCSDPQTYFESAPGNVNFIRTLADYHQANIDAAAGCFPGLIIPALEVQSSVYAGRGSRWSNASIEGRNVFIGAYCQVDRSARIAADVVLSDNIIIDRHVNLTRTVVLPDTYIGEWLDASDCLVWGDQVVEVATGTNLHLVDDFLLSNLSRSGIQGHAIL